jgi:S1-C subfamily serine protease
MKSKHFRYSATPWKWSAKPLILILSASLSLSFLEAAAESLPTLPDESRTNGNATVDALAAIRSGAVAAAARLVDTKGRPMITATWLGEDGYLLTKASEVPRMEHVRLQTSDGHLLELREVRRDAALDLVLAQVKGQSHLAGVTKLVPASPVKFGQWLAAPVQGGQEFCIGVLSAQRRKIPGMGAAIGVRMDDKSAGGKAGGVRIIGIAEDSPAALAGLRADDILLELAGKRIAKYKQVHDIISGRQPGEEIDVRFRRDGKEDKVSIRLASKTKILANWDGEDFANGGISIRTDSFAQVLQHDLPLGPRDMGSPLFNLEGHLVGINIARVDRVTTFALPAELFWSTMQEWLQADRHPPKAVFVNETTGALMPPVSEPLSRRVGLRRGR